MTHDDAGYRLTQEVSALLCFPPSIFPPQLSATHVCLRLLVDLQWLQSLDVVMDYVTKRKVEVKQADILKIVKQNSTSIAVLSPAVAKTFAELGWWLSACAFLSSRDNLVFRSAVKGNGVCLLQAGPESPEDAQCRTNIIVWVGDHVVRTLVSQGDRSHIRSEKCGRLGLGLDRQGAIFLYTKG